MLCQWNNILEEINHDSSLSGKNVIEEIKKRLQAKHKANTKNPNYGLKNNRKARKIG